MNLIIQGDLDFFLVAIDCLSLNHDRNEYNYDEKISGRNIDFWSYTDFLSQHKFIGRDLEAGN